MKRMLVVLAIISIIIGSIPVYADEPTVNESDRLIYNIVKLEDMHYTKENSYITFTTKCTLHFELNKLNRITNVFEGEFYTTDGYNYSEHIQGTFDGHDLAFELKNKPDSVFRYTFNDSTGKFSGNNTFETSIMGLLGEFVGIPYAYKDSLEDNRIELETEEQLRCRYYSADIYNADENHNYLPKKLEKELEDDGFEDIESRNFRDQYDNNVSYTIAHKKFNYKNIEELDKVIVVIRGTDTYEWLGNMKICPPDNEGNFDRYTFTSLEGSVHANFANAAQLLEDELNEYINNCFIDEEYTEAQQKEALSKVVVTLTGHSRGGAVSNLLAKNLVDNRNYIPNVTAYTFATPNVAYCSSIENSQYMESYTNIYNFCKNKDFIPYIPLVNRQWSYWKYGETYV